MRIEVDRDLCEGVGMCQSMAHELFELDGLIPSEPPDERRDLLDHGLHRSVTRPDDQNRGSNDVRRHVSARFCPVQALLQHTLQRVVPIQARHPHAKAPRQRGSNFHTHVGAQRDIVHRRYLAEVLCISQFIEAVQPSRSASRGAGCQ